MTRRPHFDVRIPPAVRRLVDPGDSGHGARRASHFFDGMDRLSIEGTRAAGVKKLKGREVWEMRLGDRRAFFCLVPGTRIIAVGALSTKKSRRLSSNRLRVIERAVHAWRTALEDER